MQVASDCRQMADEMSNALVAAPATEPDWNLIRERYLAGDEAQDIAEACGTTAGAIYSKAYRDGWRAEALRSMCQDEASLSRELRTDLLVNIYREARMLGKMSTSRNASEADAWSRVRERCISAAARLLRWDEDPLARAKAAKCIDLPLAPRSHS